MKINLNKKGVSEMVAYVILIVIALALSLIVYAWLKSQVIAETKECPEGASLIIIDYDCNEEDNIIGLDIENKGRFSLDGFYIKGGNEGTQGVSIYPLRLLGFGGEAGYAPFDINDNLKPGEVKTRRFNYEDVGNPGSIKSVEIIPFKLDEKGKPLICKYTSSNIQVDCGL